MARDRVSVSVRVSVRVRASAWLTAADVAMTPQGRGAVEQLLV